MTSTTDVSGKTVRQVVEEQSDRVLETYRIDNGLIQEHANGERRINQGGYGERQIYELVQNGADEMRTLDDGEIRVILTEHYLYCANTGNPMTPEGADTILRMSVSRKRGGQIGRFGVGVKSVLSVSDAPEFYSSTGSFGFDRDWAAERIRGVAPGVAETPVLRLARPIETQRARNEDRILDELLARAVTVVRLPLTPGSAERLGADLRSFPPEFQLFSPHVAHLHLEDRRPGRTLHRVMSAKASQTLHTLQGPGEDGKQTTSVWNVFRRTHQPSVNALRSAGELHDRPEIDLAWAVPQEAAAVAAPSGPTSPPTTQPRSAACLTHPGRPAKTDRTCSITTRSTTS
ncbi:sacsin N-terminal ATP-binding-like domain-containing protein [Catellatospora coxensis]